MTSDSYSVLFFGKDAKVTTQIRAFLTPPTFEVVFSEDENEARRLLDERTFNIIIADNIDGSGVDFAVQASSSYSAVLLLVASEHFDEISYRVEGYGVLTMTKPFEPFYFYNMVKIAIAVQYKIQVLSSQTVKLKSKMEEIRVVNRAKLLLVEKKGLSEESAHHYLEKQAMNTGLTRIRVAENVIKEFA